MRRRARLAALCLASAALSGCGHQEAPAPLPRTQVRAVPGPAYVEQVLNGRAHTVIHTPSHVTRLQGAPEVTWRGDGAAVVSDRERARLLDPTTGRWLAGPVRVGDFGVTPTSLTTLDLTDPTRVTVYDAELRRDRVIRVPAAEAESDQVGEDAEFTLHGRPITLDGVTWVEWGINSEDDTLTDHGLFRIEGARITQTLRNRPLVDLRSSSDGSALLAVMQDNGEDEDCGGCQVEQRIAELDPAAGEVAIDHDMPEGYTRSWRISALDKIGTEIVVQFAIRTGESGGHYETWRLSDEWRRVGAGGSARTRFQRGGSLAWRGDTGEQNRPYELIWRPESGAPQTLRDRRTPCPTDRTDWTSCPSVSIPGSLLPLRER